MPLTTAPDALAVLDLLANAGAPATVAGGWGIDALIGRQTREHADLDVVVCAEHEGIAITALEQAGYVVTTDWRPVRVALTHPDGSEVDLHPLSYLPDGGAIQQGLDGMQYHYPADGFTTGIIEETEVPCITAELQVRFHTGYEPSEIDRADMAVLAAAAGVDLPEPHGGTS